MPAVLESLRTTDRPRERLWALGAPALATPELLAIMLGTGTRLGDVLTMSQALLASTGGSLRRHATRPASEWQRQGGIGPTKAARMLAS